MAQNFDLDFLVPLYIGQNTASSHVAHSQLAHRINLVRDIWQIPASSSVLEIGCGQGDCTLVLAAAVGDSGHVDAIDPCDLNYGAPYTVGDAQAFLKHGALGARMTFIQADPVDWLANSGKVYDYAVLNNSLWYFDAPARIGALLAVLAPRTHARKILIAEWSLEARSLEQVPHVLAALARENLEYLNKGSGQNIRTAVSPAWFRRWFAAHGVEVEREEMVLPPREMADGKWEVKTLLSERFVEQAKAFAGSEQQFVALQVMRDAVTNAVQQLEKGADDVQCMMIWAATI